MTNIIQNTSNYLSSTKSNLVFLKDFLIKPFKSIYNKYLAYFLLGFCGFLLFQYGIKQYKNNCDSAENKYYIDPDEIIPGINYYLYPKEQIRHIFWTGGFDSTFLLIQALVINGEPIQPIYIKCGNLDEKFGLSGRNNQKYEIKTMKNIRKKILEDYPFCKPMFLPTLYVYGVQKDNSITKQFKYIHDKFNYFSRDINQYERMARFSYYYGYPIEVGLEKCGTGLDEATNGLRINEGTKQCRVINLDYLKQINLKDNKLNDIQKFQVNKKIWKGNLDYTCFDIFRNFRFPIVHLDKKDCKRIAMDQKKYYILQLTWTCWYPLNNGNQCGECPQCLSRQESGV